MLSPIQQKLARTALDWIGSKIEAAEGFSVLMVSQHPAGKRSTKYSFDTVEEALMAAREELRGDLGDASDYALVYDAWVRNETGNVPVFIVRIESRSDPEAMTYVLPYEMEERAGTKKILISGELQLLDNEDGWLVRSAI